MLILVLAGCGLSASELQNISAEYESSLKNLCESYGLTDASIEVGSQFTTRDTSINMYVESATVTSEKFNSLSPEKAFSFAKEFYYLDNKYNTEKSRVSFTTVIYGKNGDRYTYETKHSPNSNFEYLMRYSESAVTYEGGKLIFDDFYQE